MASYDILTDIDNETNPFELLFLSGDFIVDLTDEQNIRLALLSSKGNWKQYPLVGAEIFKLLHHSNRSNYNQLFIKELERIGYRVTSLSIGDNPTDFNLDVEEL